MSRTIPQLRQAIQDAGFDGDPLCAELVSKLGEQEAQIATLAAQAALVKDAAPAAQVDTKSRLALWGAMAAAGVSLVALFATVSMHRTAMAERDRQLATIQEIHARELVQRDTLLRGAESELARVKDENSKELRAMAQEIRSSLILAEATAKSSASAADLNFASTGALSREIDRILDQRLPVEPPTKP